MMMHKTPVRVRAVLFVALSGAAVPACQHVDGDAPRGTQMAVRRVVEGARLATPHDPRLRLRHRSRG